MREGEHLDLGELVDAIEPPAGAAGGAGLGPEAMRQADVADRQRRLVEDLVGEHPSERDLGRADQAEVGILDGIDLGLGPARREPDPLEDLVAGQVGRDDGREAVADELLDGELLERQVQEHGIVLEEVEAGPADLAARLEVDQVEVLAQRDVVLGLEVEGAGRADLADLAALVLGLADGGVRVGQVGDALQPLGQLGLEPAEPLLLVGDRRLEPLAFVDQRGPLLGVALAAGGLGDLVLPAPDLLDPLEQAPALGLELRRPDRRPRSRRARRCGPGNSA